MLTIIMRLVTRVIGVFVLLPILLCAVMPLAWSVRAARGVIVLKRLPAHILNRHPSCPVSDVLTGIALRRIRRDDAIEAVSKVLAADARFTQASTPQGVFWVPNGELGALYEMVGEEERAIYDYGDIRVRPGDIVLDCGANVGVTVRRALKLGAAKVVAIELASAPLECLRRNFASEIQQGKVIVYPKGVWDRDAELELTGISGIASTASSVAFQHEENLEKVQLTTIDHLVAELHLPRVDFIKMDIEGAEGAALQGAQQTVATLHPRLAISLEHRPTDPVTLPAQVRRQWPEYAVACGPCEWVGDRVQPLVMFAQPAFASR
jgi:FkbM family methyltransferase